MTSYDQSARPVHSVQSIQPVGVPGGAPSFRGRRSSGSRHVGTLVGLIGLLAGCGLVENDGTTRAGPSQADDDGGAIAAADGGSGNSNGAGGADTGSSTGGGAGLPDECKAGMSEPPPMKEIPRTYSEDPAPEARGGIIPVPSAFVAIKRRIVGPKSFDGWGTYGLNFISATHMDQFFGEVAQRMTWRVESLDGKVENHLVLLRKCGPDEAVRRAYNYTYEDGVLTLMPSWDGSPADEVYTYQRIDD